MTDAEEPGARVQMAARRHYLTPTVVLLTLGLTGCVAGVGPEASQQVATAEKSISDLLRVVDEAAAVTPASASESRHVRSFETTCRYGDGVATEYQLTLPGGGDVSAVLDQIAQRWNILGLEAAVADDRVYSVAGDPESSSAPVYQVVATHFEADGQIAEQWSIYGVSTCYPGTTG